MDDKSHAEDTTFVVAEPDFVFFREDAEAWPGYLSQNEAETQTFQRFSEMAFLARACGRRPGESDWRTGERDWRTGEGDWRPGGRGRRNGGG